MTITYEIGKYNLKYNAKTPKSYAIATIQLYDHKNRGIARIAFFPKGQPVPNSSANQNQNSITLVLRSSENQLDRIVDMLRNEKPCFVTYHSPTNAFVHTGKEPIGEEEYRKLRSKQDKKEPNKKKSGTKKKTKEKN